MSELIDSVFFRVATPNGPGLVIGYYRELNYIFGQWEEKKNPDYTFLVAMDSGSVMVLAGAACKLEG